MTCTPNQISANCFNHNKSCVYSCGNATDDGCVGAGMYGYLKPCPTPSIPHPRVNEGYFTPDTPEKIARLSADGFDGSRSAGYLYLPDDPSGISSLGRALGTKMAISSSNKHLFIGLGITLFVLIVIFLLYRFKHKLF